MKHTHQPRERNRTTSWATRLDPNYTAAYGCNELHAAFFTSEDDAGGPWLEREVDAWIATQAAKRDVAG
jgi:hypothetical protein